MDVKAAQNFFRARARVFVRREDRDDFVQEALLDYLEQCAKKGAQQVSFSWCAAHAYDRHLAKQLRRNRKMTKIVENENTFEFNPDSFSERITHVDYHRLKMDDGPLFLLDDYDVMAISRFSSPKLVREAKSRSAPIKLWLYRDHVYQSISDVISYTGHNYYRIRKRIKPIVLRWLK
jgi:hypothetical protein